MKKFILSAFTFCSVCFTLIYILSCLTPYISPVTFWPMSFLSLGFPYLTVGFFVLIIIWLFIRKKVGLWLSLILILAYSNISSTTGCKVKKQSAEKLPGTLRILSWNVRGFDNPSTYIDSPGSVRQQMFDYIKQTKPDIICTQEFTEHIGKGLISNSTELLDMGYNYFYRTDEMSRLYPYGLILSGTAIFSKLPILNQGKVMFADSSFPEHLAFIDVKMQDKMLRVFSTHFKSFNFNSANADTTRKVKFYGDSNFIYKASKFEKIKVFSQEHIRQSKKTKQIVQQSPYPYVLCMDMNDVPASYCYHTLAKGLQDAFLQKGLGIGCTMDSLPPTLRIDYLFAQQKIAIENYTLHKLHLSDHYPQIIDIRWKD